MELARAAIAAGAQGLTWHAGVARDRWNGGLCSSQGEPTAEGQRVAAFIAQQNARTPHSHSHSQPQPQPPQLPQQPQAHSPPQPAVALIVSRTDTRHGLASSLVDPAPPAALELLGLGAAGAAALGADRDAPIARRWFDAVAQALDLARVAWIRVDERVDLAALPVRAFVVPTLTRVDRALWRQLQRLAAERRTIVIGPTLPTLDELGEPLGADATPPRRAGTMRPGSLDDVPGLAADLAALDQKK